MIDILILFNEARQDAPTILFIDKLDKLVTGRDLGVCIVLF